MAVSKTLQEFLQAARVKYTAARHSVAYTAQEIAASQHVSGKQLAKSVLVKTNQGPVLAVLPATHLIDFARLKAALRATSLSIAKEADIKAQFPDVEVGAMSPFGNLYHVPVVADRMLAEVGDIVFNAGSHTDTIRLAYRDFVALAKPAVASFAKSRDKAKPKAKPKARKAKKPARKPARRKR